MRIPFFLRYIQKRGGGVEYTQTQTGILDVARLANDKPPWKKAGSPQETKFKKIILADWTAANWSLIRIAHYKKLLEEMMDSGFECYVWQDGEVIKLTQDNLRMLNRDWMRNRITIATDAEIISAAVKQQSLTKDSIFILDYFQFDAIEEFKRLKTEDEASFLKRYNSGHPIYVSMIAHSPHPRQLIYDYIRRMTHPKVVRLVQDEFSLEANKAVFELKKNFADIKVVGKRYNTLALTMNQIEILIHQRSLRLYGRKITLEDLERIGEFKLVSRGGQEVSKGEGYNHFLQFMHMMPNLVVLDLGSLKVPVGVHLGKKNLMRIVGHISLSKKSDFAFLAHQNIHDISAMITNGTNIKPEQLSQLIAFSSERQLTLEKVSALLSKANHLQVLKLLVGEHPAPTLAINLDELVSLDLKADMSTLQLTLEKLLEGTTHKLTVLTVEGDSHDSFPARLNQKNKLSQLQSLTIKNVKLTEEGAASLSAIAALEELTLKDVKLATYLIPNLTLASLRRLEISSTHVTPEWLDNLLDQAPNLEELVLNNMDYLLSTRESPFVFKKLKHVFLTDCRISQVNLERLLVNANQLETLVLVGGIDTSYPSCKVHLKHLRQFSASSFYSFHENDVMNMLADSLELEELTLPSGHQQYGPLSEYDFLSRFKNLTHLTIQAHIFRCSTLEYIASLGTITTLTFKAKRLVDNFSSLPLFHSLLTLNLISSEMNTEQCIELLQKMPNVVELNIKHCPYIDIADPTLKEIFSKLIRIACDISFAGAPKALREVAQGAAAARPSTGSLTDPRHRPERFLEKKRPQEDDQFQYEGRNQTKNQAMICEKLLQYIILTGQGNELIPKLKEGICASLSRLFMEKEIKKWEAFIKCIQCWDGRHETITASLRQYLDELMQLSKAIYVENRHVSTRIFIGDSIDVFIHTLPVHTFFKSFRTGSKYMLENPWHTICIKRISSSLWYVYDPNFVDGYKKINDPALLVQIIHQSIGKLISVCDIKKNMALFIPDLNEFFGSGGLLALIQADNAFDMLTEIDSHDPFEINENAIKGLFFRNNNATPAWAACLLSSNVGITRVVITLLEKFIAVNQTDWQKTLVSSMSEMTAFEKYEVLEKCHLFKTDAQRAPLFAALPSFVETLSSEIHDAGISLHSHYDAALETWKRGATSTLSPAGFLMHLMQPRNRKKCLLEVDGDVTAWSLNLLLQQHCIMTHRPVFYIHSPDDLVCSASFIERQAEDAGVVRKGPGGKLHEYLIAQKEAVDPAPVLIINYSAFKPDDIVRLNAILDDKRFADGTPVPKNMLIVGTMNINKPDVYQGEDFYSRFDEIVTCPFDYTVLMHQLKPLSVTNQSDEPTYVINLCDTKEWADHLLGHWVLDGDKLHFQEGSLLQALASNQPIELQNAPWDDERFQFFWRQAVIRGYVEIAGKHIPCPGDLRIVRTEGYDWEALTKHIKFDRHMAVDVMALNTSSVIQCHFQHTYADGKLFRQPGWLQAHQDKTLHLNVTSNLSQSEWASILLTCQAYNVMLVCHAAPTVTISTILQSGKEEADYPHIIFPDSTHTSVIQSTDPDVTLHSLRQKHRHAIVINITDCEPSDLLRHLDGRLDAHDLTFKFSQTERALLRALNQNQTVILKGEFKPALADALASLIIERQTHAQGKGCLILLSENVQQFRYITIEERQVSVQDKRAILKDDADLLHPTFLENEPLKILQARINHKKANPIANINEEGAWLGMDKLPQTKLNPFDEHTSEAHAEAFNQKRLHDLNRVLEHAPYAFITGLTGVGKSTFIDTVFRNKGATLFYGDEGLAAWAKDTSAYPVLFYDEANMTGDHFSQFEGLFDDPRSILVNGEYIQLSPHHRVIFAANPVSYGGDRKLAKFFVDHGNAVVFDPLPMAYIYEYILKPVFEHTALEEQALTISKLILNVYQYLCEHSKEEVLISPRELQMMALLILSYQHRTHADKKKVLIASQHYIYTVAKHLVPDHLLDEFNQLFTPESAITTLKGKGESEFLFTESRDALSQQINDMLALRAFKRTNPGDKNDSQKYGGINGIVIEGEAGIGKSAMVVKCILDAGGKPFYHMPVSMQLDDKIALLMKAFHEGAIVIIDEVNSAPMMEKLLNDLLMGKSPDGGRADNPGFMMIGTQNPVTMAGRRAASPALKRRVITVTLPPYSRDEMIDILVHRDLPNHTAAELVSSFQRKRAEAEHGSFNPLPTFRDLLRLSDDVLRGTFDQPHTQSDVYPHGLFSHEKSAVSPDEPAVRPDNRPQ